MRWFRHIAWAPLAVAAFAAQAGEVPTFTRTQTQFIEFCGGCHGLNGVSVPQSVPTLRGRVGYFLCNADSRAYLGQLPNVALSPFNNEDLAKVMNFVIFDLGEGSAPENAKPFTADEISKLREKPLNKVALSDYRAKIVDTLVSDCGAPESLKEYSLGFQRK